MYGKRLVGLFFSPEFHTPFVQNLYFYAFWIIPSLILIGILFGFKNIFKELGMTNGFLKGFVFALITVSPMLIGSAVSGHIYQDLKPAALMRGTLVAGLLEEVFFRGFLFGILFRKLKWGFVPASVLGAVIFGIGHLYQGDNLTELIGIFLVTAMGAVWFAWLYIEWNNNLWVPVFLHVLMNLSWALFDVSDNALGGLGSNVFRGITIALTVIITIRYHKKRGLKIHRRNLIISES
jgi:membrane protease YdiL (CAAX protease family)